MHDTSWQAVIGLEVHTQLNTQTKLFSPAPNRFGDEPNTNIHPICLGLPGTLPLLNKEAVRKAVVLGCALESEICKHSQFDRKSYFYPDAPRNFQITQFYEPIIRGGVVEACVDGKWTRFQVDRAHLEDDAGMLKHFTSFAGVDYNRAGAPLIEIVSKPCIHNAKEAAAYVSALKQILQHMNISDCNMEEGQLRIDVNVSVRRVGETSLRPKAEIKNMNSISNMEMAIDSEIQRQIRLYEQNPDVAPDQLLSQSTYRWDPERKEIVLMRSKETAADYRYFPEPDLPPIVLDDDFIRTISNQIPELPNDKFRRYQQQFKIATATAALLVEDKKLCDFFEKGLETLHESVSHAQNLCNWMLVEFAGRFKDSSQTLLTSGIKPQDIAELVLLIEEGTITGRIAKSVCDDMVKEPGISPRTIVERNPNYRPVSDDATLTKVIQDVIEQNPQALIDLREGKQRAYGFLVGKLMGATKGQADPAVANRLLKESLTKLGIQV